MRQASWEDMFKAQVEAQRPPEPPSIWSRLAIFSWEELVTLVIVLISFLTVVQSIDSADWVAEMPSLYSIALLGLVTGLALSRLRFNEALIHLLAVGIGVLGTIMFSTAELEGSLADRTR